jgi:hypothetical protein
MMPAKLVFGAIPMLPDPATKAANLRDELLPRELFYVFVHAPTTPA